MAVTAAGEDMAQRGAAAPAEGGGPSQQATERPQQPQKRQRGSQPAPQKDPAARTPPPCPTGAIDKAIKDAQSALNIRQVVCQRYSNLATQLVESFSADELAEHRACALKIRAAVEQQILKALFDSPTVGTLITPPESPRAGREPVGYSPPAANVAAAPPAVATPARQREGHPGLYTSAGTQEGRTKVRWSHVAALPDTQPRVIPVATQRTRREKAPKDDLRVLVRVNSLAAREREPYTLRKELEKRLGLEKGSIRALDRTPSGWAVKTRDLDTRQLLLSEERLRTVLEILEAESATLYQKWYTYAVQNVPFTINTPFADSPLRTEDEILQEIQVQTGQKAVDAHVSRRGAYDTAPRATWIISFLKPARPFKLFGTTSVSRLVQKKDQIGFHEDGCLGYCHTRRCVRPRRCKRCGERLADHPAGECTRPVRCANCCGPFLSGHEGCPAAPRQERGRWIFPTPRRRADIRKFGRHRFNEAHEAEETAANINTPVIQATNTAPTRKRARSPDPATDLQTRLGSPPAPTMDVIHVASTPSPSQDTYTGLDEITRLDDAMEMNNESGTY